MTAIEKRRTGAFTDLLDWLEAGVGLAPRDPASRPYVRVEDFVKDGSYVLRAEMPGIDPDKDIELSVVTGELTIRGERREEKQEKNRSEFHYGSFSRTIPLPEGVDASDVTATYVDGVLEVRAPVRTGTPTAQKVPVQRPDAS